MLYFCHKWTLLCCGRFHLYLLSGELFLNYKWVLNFIESFCCVYWDDHMVFIFQFVNMVYHTDWFVVIEESLYPQDKSLLIMVYYSFNVLLDLVCWEFCWEFLHLCSSVTSVCSLLFLWHLCLVWYQGDGGLIELVVEFSFLYSFLEEF